MFHGALGKEVAFVFNVWTFHSDDQMVIQYVNQYDIQYEQTVYTAT